ncbi:MAG: ABC transporter permease [Streptosporangiaceae bacterium]
MIPLGLRLTMGGGKEAAVRLIVTTAAVALGVGLLLIALAGVNAINAQNARTAWLNTSVFGHGPPGGLPGAPPSSNQSRSPLWWLFSADQFGNQTIYRVDVAATGPEPPVLPGIAHLPGPGQFYASPALTRLLDSTPADELSDRFPGRQAGTIGPSALPAPNSLIIVIGRTAAQLSGEPRAAQVTSINTGTGHGGGPTGFSPTQLEVILAVGALALLFPVLVFIGTATRLAAARREQRFAAIRLAGATPQQVSVISAVEASVAALAGVAVGFGVFFALRPVLTNIPFTGEPFAPGDMSLAPLDVLLVLIGVPAAAVVAARVAMRRVQISPLGVSRRVTPPAPRPYRLLPLAAGIGELAYFLQVGHPSGAGAQILAYGSAFLLIMAGLVIGGPWLTMAVSQATVRRTGMPAVLLAGRRLSDDPRAAFRAISGLIIAIFVTSVSVGVITTILGNHSVPGGTSTSGTLLDQFYSPPPGQPASAPSVSAARLARLRTIRGVEGVTVIYSGGASHGAPRGSAGLLVSCTQLARTPAIGHCASGAGVAAITGTLDSASATSRSTLADTVWPRASASPARLPSLPAWGIIVQTDGSSPAIELARTALEIALPGHGSPATLSKISESNARVIAELHQLTNVVIIISLVIAGCSLAVSVTAGVNDRKRPFSLLRLTGVPVRTLRRVVALEAALPLVVISVLSAGIGFLAAALFLRSQLGETLRAPGADYYALIAAGLVASLAIITSTLPLIERITGPETARTE